MDNALIEQARQVDLFVLAARYTTLRRVSNVRNAGAEYAGPCPLCRDGKDRFRVQPDQRRWFCRHCTGEPGVGGHWHDVIDFYMRLNGVSFVDAVTALAGPSVPSAPSQPLPPAVPERDDDPPPDPWQKRAAEICELAQTALWSPAGAARLDYLRARGLLDETIRAARLGCLLHPRRERGNQWGMPDEEYIYLPRGLFIPCVVDSVFWYIAVRRDADDIQQASERGLKLGKYQYVKGWRPAFYLADTLAPATEAACITEGQMDALILRQSLLSTNARWRNIGVTTLGSKSMRPELEHWARYFYRIPRLLVFAHQDGESQNMIEYWTGHPFFAECVTWPNIRPGDKDLNDYYLSGGNLLDLVVSQFMDGQRDTGVPPSPEPVGADSQAVPRVIRIKLDDEGLRQFHNLHALGWRTDEELSGTARSCRMGH